MAGTVTVTMSGSDSERINGLERASIAWATSAGAECSGLVSRIQGTVEKVVFVPGAGGAQPSPAYDVTLKDQDGLDVLGGTGADLANDTVVVADLTDADPVFPIATAGLLTLDVLNAGASKTGTVRVFFRR